VEQVSRDFRPEAVVGVAKGGVVPAVVIASAFSVDFYPVKLSTRRNEEIVLDAPRVVTPPPDEVRGRRVLLVDDISVTMQTLDRAKELLERAGAAEVRCASFCVHGASRKPEWFALESSDVILMPWDRDVYRDGGWVMNPEYEQEITCTGPGVTEGAEPVPPGDTR